MIQMKNISTRLLFLMIVIAGAEAFAQTTEPYKPQCDADPNHIASMVGTVALSLGVERVASPTMACLLKLWRKDKGGTMKYYTSNAFLAVMDQNPRLFFASMANEAAIFDEWLNRMQADSFTWPLDPPCPLDMRRTELIAVLEHVESLSPNLSALKAAVIAKLSSIRCRQIK